jgi:uncharacterized protein DUF4328
MRASSIVAGRWLWFCFGLALVALVLDVLWLKKQAGGPWAWEDLANLGKLMDTLAVVQLLVTIVGAVIFIIWFQRGYSNLAALSPSKPRWSRGWAIAGWFVPLVSLVIPKQIANDLWRAGEGGARVPAVVHWWWALFLLSSVLGGFAGSAMGDA